MDQWLQDDIKELLAKPCLATAGMLGRRMDNRRRPMGQEIDERALTEFFVDAFDTTSGLNAWGTVIQLLKDRGLFLNTSVRKSTVEHLTGADLGLILTRNFNHKSNPSKAKYAALIQCKRVDNQGKVEDFYHVVKSTGKKQSSLLLDITPASFYFLYTPPSFIETYCTVEPLAFVQGAPGCSSPVWNMGCFGFENRFFSFLDRRSKGRSNEHPRGSGHGCPCTTVERHASIARRVAAQRCSFLVLVRGTLRSRIYWRLQGRRHREGSELQDRRKRCEGRLWGRFSIELNIGNG